MDEQKPAILNCKKINIQMKFSFCCISMVFLLPKRLHIPYVLSEGGTHIESIPQRLPKGESNLWLEQGGVKIHHPLDALLVPSLHAEGVE